MARLGIEKYNSAFSKALQPLLEADWIGVMDASNLGLGHIYYLKRKGAFYLRNDQGNDISQIHFCQNTPRLSAQSAFHRTAAIDCQIEFMASCPGNEAAVIFYHRDIEVLGSIRGNDRLVRKTRVPIQNQKHLEPDAIFMIETPKGKKLYCLEFENEDYTKKSYLKIEAHVAALNLKSPSKKYKHDKAHKTLFIYKNASTMKSIMEMVNENISGIGNWFLFKSYEEVCSPFSFNDKKMTLSAPKDFFANWKSASGTPHFMY
jgi:hypothetical protein